jgi:type I restriction enzyme R subunit
MSGNASDEKALQPHIRNKSKRDALAKRIKDPEDSMKLVIVRDMWLTGFDAPCMHTMYVDKPMSGHNLMQAIARVNRVFKDKPGGLVVDYLGIAEYLKQALSAYTDGDRREAGIPQDQAVAVMQEKYEIVLGLMHGFDLCRFDAWTPKERLVNLAKAMEHIAGQQEGIKRFVKAVGDLSKAFALAVPHEDALAIRNRIAYFQALRAAFMKNTVHGGGPTEEDLDAAVRQLVSQAVATEDVIDVFASAGLQKPEISLLSDQFLEEVKALPHRNLALELLRKLINDEIKSRSKKNIVQARSFTEMLEKAILQYQNRAIDAAQVISELIELAKQMRAARERGESLGLTEDEEAFYDALGANESAVQVLGDEILKAIARDLAATIRKNVSIDWTSKESVRAKLRVLVKRLLNKYGYPPDRQALATQTVLDQATLIAKDWAM